MSMKVIFLAIVIMVLVPCILADRNDNDEDRHGDGNRRTSTRCNFNHPDFQRRNDVMLKSLAGARIPIPTQIWSQHVHYVPQIGPAPSHAYIEVADYYMYQYNRWNQDLCAFTHEEYNFIVKTDGSVAIHVEQINAEPLAPTWRTGNGAPVEGLQEYYVYWNSTTPPSFANVPVAAGKSTQVAMSPYTICDVYGDMGIPGKHHYATEEIDVLVPNHDRDYSIMIYPEGQPTIWVAFDSEAIEFPPIIAAARAAYLAGQFTLQPDPTAAAYGIDYRTLVWDIPAYPTSARSMNNALSFVNKTEVASANMAWARMAYGEPPVRR